MPELIVLFDGVCNLCHGAVQWILAHDRKGLFRFASLQSRIAKETVTAAGGPAITLESIVLIENGRIRTESDAVIAIASHLGFPWSLAILGRILPRAGRDAIYRWVARNRYRWFGRQGHCLIPTPDIRARFIDADEPRPVVPESETPPTPPQDNSRPPQALGSAILTTAYRWLILELFLQIVPFPFGVIPGTEFISRPIDAAKNVVVPWLGRLLFGIEITILPNGSGDTTYNYVEVLMFALLATVGAVLWSISTGFAPVTPRIRDYINTYVRYFLAGNMLLYGWDKVFLLQMPSPDPGRLMETFGNASPMALLWTFIGASPAYQIFGGLLEVTAGFLLLWRRTTLLGALLSAGVLVNVVLLNLCYDVPVKLFSSHLLLMALFLVAPHGARLAAVLVLNLPAQPAVLRPFPTVHPGLRRTGRIVKAILVILFVVGNALEDLQRAIQYASASPEPWQGYYQVESFENGANPPKSAGDRERWIKVGIASSGRTCVLRADGSTRSYRFQIDPKGQTASTTPRPPGQPVVLRFRMPDSTSIELEGQLEGKSILAKLKRLDEPKPPLMSRGFHWINEFPRN
jgi:predicted DCC family thiol-disulfide oxidoreductase YuxK